MPGAQPRRAAQQQVDARIEAAARLDAGVRDAIGEAEQRADLGVGRVGPPGAEGERRVVALRARARHDRDAGGLIELEQLRAALGERLVEVAGAELVLLLGERASAR